MGSPTARLSINFQGFFLIPVIRQDTIPFGCQIQTKTSSHNPKSNQADLFFFHCTVPSFFYEAAHIPASVLSRVALQTLSHCQHHHDDGYQQEACTDGPCDKRCKAPLAEHQRSAQILLRHRPQNKAQNHRGNGKIKLFKEISHNGENKNSNGVEHPVINANTSNDTKGHHHRQQILLANHKETGEYPHAKIFNYQHKNIGNNQGAENPIYDLRICTHQERAGAQPMQRQSPQQQGCGGISRNAQGNQGHHVRR